MKYAPQFFIFFLIFTSYLLGQEAGPAMEGIVSFVTTNNVYVKFADTESILIGDSLELLSSNTSCLIVKSKSSTSCVCIVVEGCTINKGDTVLFTPKLASEPDVSEEEVITSEKDKDMFRLASAPLEEEIEEELIYKENIRGSVAASSYSTLFSDRSDLHRIMTQMSVNANHINNSRFSANAYINYRQIIDEPESSSLTQNNFVRIYNLGGRFDATPTLSFTLGRNINPKMSSVGAIDGLQVEKYFGKSYLGIVGGFRPDIFNYGFNADLQQYGGYFGTTTNSQTFRSETTIGFIEQRGNGDIDRRYTYLQHTGTLFKDLNLFVSAELDIFSKVNFTTKNDLRLTNLYFSARYRFNRKVNLMVSYDSRKRILYYETFQTDIERLLDEDIARQGVRARLSFRPVKYVNAGLSYGKRFQSDEQNQSENMNGYVTFSRLPQVGGRLNLSYNRNTSSYLESNIASVRHSRSLTRNNRLNADFYYRYVHYKYTNLSDPLQQNYFGTSLSYNLTRNLLLSISGELTTFNEENNYRIYTRIVQRFYRKAKK